LHSKLGLLATPGVLGNHFLLHRRLQKKGKALFALNFCLLSDDSAALPTGILSSMDANMEAFQG